MQPNRIDDPGHSDLRQHAIPPVKTGQIVCYKTRTYLVSPTKQSLPGFVFETGAVGFRIFSAITSRRVLLDDLRFTTNTDRATDVPDTPSLPECEHSMASRRAAYCC